MKKEEFYSVPMLVIGLDGKMTDVPSVVHDFP